MGTNWANHEVGRSRRLSHWLMFLGPLAVVTAVSVHEMAIGVLWDEGLTTGCGAGRYCPNDHITRGQLAAFLYRQFGGS